jgi:transitional endoplasmic reticulum ATPase
MAQLRKSPVAPDVDINVLARSTHGFSGADISEICTSASKLAIREAILATELRMKKIQAGEIEEDEVDESSSVANNMLVTKRYFNIAMSKARRSVSEKDLALYEEFAEKQKAGRGEAATNFKFGDGEGEEDEEAVDDDLYT